jgi:hypothetical protein
MFVLKLFKDGHRAKNALFRAFRLDTLRNDLNVSIYSNDYVPFTGAAIPIAFRSSGDEKKSRMLFPA